ncbi:MAG: type I-E CRISPR-associated protein Cse2/CasB [Burkholderiales bacterium]
MSEHSMDFVTHLVGLAARDRGALAALRRSLAFAPGAYPPAYPVVERFVGRNLHAHDARRLALYIVAGLFALHPRHVQEVAIGTALGTLMARRGSDSIEGRFVALLSAEPEHVHEYLRQLVSLLAAEGIAFDYAQLLDDLSGHLNRFADERRDAVRQRWARDFYRVVTNDDHSSDVNHATESAQ